MKRLAPVLLTLLALLATTPSASSALAGDPKGPRQLVGPVVRVQASEVAHLEGRLKNRPHSGVVLQRLSKHGWVGVRDARTDGDGAFHFRVTASSHVGSTKYRVVQGSHRTETTKVRVVKAGRWRSLSAGASYTCGVRLDHSGWCWGRNTFGQLGTGDLTDLNAPRRLPGKWRDIATTFRDSTCGVRTDGSGWCWGTYPGNGDVSSKVPVRVPGVWRSLFPISYSEFSGGPVTVNCGIRTDDTAWCRGDNLAGELGTGDPDTPGVPVLTPHQVPGLWRELSDASHTQCGIRTDGSGWCWGFNYAGQVGDGSTTDRTSPVQVPGTWSSLAPSEQGTTCGIRTDGTGWCWGANREGAVGDGTELDRLTPSQLPGHWQTLSARSSTVCGVQTDGSGWCWGRNGQGQVGNGTKETRLTPDELPGRWRSVSSNYSTCGVRLDGTGWCWGANFTGNVGDGTTEDRLTPYRLRGRHWVDLTPGYLACGTRSDKSAWCWGTNGDGALADGTTADRATPHRLPGRWTDFRPGGCGIRPDHTAWCWGRNSRGQTGSGIDGDVLRPVVLP